MLFQKRFHAGIADGSITRSFRSWQAPRVKPGGCYRIGDLGEIEVSSVDRVRVRDVRAADAARSGFADRDALLDYLRGAGKRTLRADSPLYRVDFRYAGRRRAADPAAERLSTAGVEALVARLARMDRLSRHGAWTRPTLELIEAEPRVAASRLAKRVGRETQPFKADVRKLKKLGLTRSFEVGYELSANGRALLRRLRRDA